MRRIATLVALALVIASSVQAQTLRDRIANLFIFGSGSNVLQLGGTASPNNPDAVRAADKPRKRKARGRRRKTENRKALLCADLRTPQPRRPEVSRPTIKRITNQSSMTKRDPQSNQ